jgi:hypothetical protein
MRIRQHRAPYLVRQGQVHQLQPATSAFNESWIQGFIFTNYQAIPVSEIEPAFGPLIPVCRELPTKAGPIDLLFVNQAGLLTLAECKLWKNPEARREVVGQILDYAKEISRWSYEDLQQAISQAQEVSEPSLYKLASQNAEDLDERDFIDSVARNLRRGRFLLLIIGDGIRESVEQLADFLQKYGHLNFSFALVEFGIFKLPDSSSGEYFIQPRVLTQTIESVRAVFRIENNEVIPITPSDDKASSIAKRTQISEQVFFETLGADPETKHKLKQFFDRVQDMDLYVEPGENSMKLKSSLHDINFGIFTTKGEFYNCGIASKTADMGYPRIGEEYLSQLAKLVGNGYVDQSTSRFWWTIKSKIDHRYIKASEILQVQGKWLELIQKTLNEIAEVSTS